MSFGKYEEIPEEWEVKSLGDVSDVFGGMPAPKDDAIFDQGTIPFVRMQDLGRYHETNNLEITRDKLNSHQVKEKKFNIIKKGAILIPRSGSVALNHRAILGNDSCIVSHICALVTKNTMMNNEYLYHLLCTIDMRKITSKTTGLDAITFEDLKKLKLFYPSTISEQKQIASILSNVDDTLQKTNQIIEQTQRLKTGMMQKLLARGIGHTKFKKVKWLFGKEIEIPEKSKVSKIDEFLIDIKYGTSKKSNVKGVGLPLLGIPHIIGGEIQYENVEHVDLHESEIQKLKLKNDDMLFVRTNGNPNYIGRCALFQKESESWVYASYLIRVRVDKTKIFPEYLMRFLQSSLTRSQILRLARTSAGNYNINTKEIGSILVVVHENKEQKQIASILSNVDTQIQKEKLHKSNLERLKKGLMQKLLTGQIRVKV